MVRKKERRTPVVAKPLNDASKRNIVTNFVTAKDRNAINKDTNYVSKNVTKKVPKSMTIIKSIPIGKKKR